MLGISRQAHYKACSQAEHRALQDHLVLDMVAEKRELLPRLGGRKLYHMIQGELQRQNIKMGRDALFDLLREHNLLIKRRRSAIRTTYSKRWFNRYDNLTKGLKLTRVNQLWVSDITYVRTKSGFTYLSLITDAYSRRVMGYHLSNSLSTSGCIKALNMALDAADNTHGLIHHSDRGSQYCSEKYTQLLDQHGIEISMTQASDPLDNPLAERMNGILKQEFMDVQQLKGLLDARLILKKSVAKYNSIRPHLSLEMDTPNNVHFNPQSDNLYQDNNHLVNPTQD